MARKKEPEGAPGWWAQRWLSYMMKDLMMPPMSDGQLRSARRADVRMTVARGRVWARVGVGNYGATAEAVLKVKPVNDRDWRRLLDSAAAEPEVAQRMLIGNLGPELEALFERTGLRLFPAPSRAIPVRCSCREGGGCRHVNALVAHGAGLFDANPFLWLEVLGRQRAEVLAYLRARLADSGGTLPTGSDVAATEAAGDQRPPAWERFWKTDTDPDTIAVRPGSAAVPNALLRVLGPLSLPKEATEVLVTQKREVTHGASVFPALTEMLVPLDEVLRQYVVCIGEAATKLATGESLPIHRTENLPGKPIKLGVRLAPEVAEAVRQAGTLLSIDQLGPLCPTISGLLVSSYRSALVDALSEPPADLVTLANRYVGPRSAVLSGSAFRHVITFDDWRRGALGPDADWVRAMNIAGHRPPYSVEAAGQVFTILEPDGGKSGGTRAGSLFGVLRPEVGDELWLTVTDPERPHLVATLRRRSDRTFTDLTEPNQTVVRMLSRHGSEIGRSQLSEEHVIELLLAERRYRERLNPDQVWLLPLQVDSLSSQRPGRGIMLQWHSWREVFWRPSYSYWRGRDDAVRRFMVSLANRGESKQRVEMAIACVNWWCSSHWQGAQDSPQKAPALGAFLEFLWNLAPLQARQFRVAPERVPEILAEWFTFLSRSYPEVRDHYRDHLAACGRTAEYEHRRRTAPGSRAAEAELLAWRVEGYRWIGPERYFASFSLEG